MIDQVKLYDRLMTRVVCLSDTAWAVATSKCASVGGLAEASSVSSNVLPSFLIPASSADVATRTKAGTCVAPA